MKTQSRIPFRLACAIFACLLYSTCVHGQPPNDDPCGAIFLSVNDTACPNTVRSNVNSTFTTSVPPVIPTSGYNYDVWFKVVVPPSGSVELRSYSASMDPQMAVYSGNCSALTLIVADDDAGPGLLPWISVQCQTPGDTLYVRLWSYVMTGTFSLCHLDNCVPGVNYITGSLGIVCLTDTSVYSISSAWGPGPYNWSVYGGHVVNGGGPGDTIVAIAWDSLGWDSVGVQYSLCCGTLTYSSAHLQVISPATAPSIATLQPVVCSGCISRISVISGYPGSNGSWSWYTDSCNGTPFASGTTVVLHPTATTTYFIRANNYNCGDTSCDSVTVTVLPTGFEDLVTVTWQVYPNPIQGELTIRYAAAVGDKPVMKIFDLPGRLAYEAVLETGDNQFSLSLAEGVYILVLDDGLHRYQQTLVVK